MSTVFNSGREKVRNGEFIVNADLSIAQVDPRLEASLGYGPDAMLDRSFLDLSPSDDEQIHRSFFADLSKTGMLCTRIKLLTVDYEIIEFLVSAYAIRDPSGTLKSYVLNLTSVKDVVESEVRTAEFQRMFMFSNDAVVITNSVGDIIDVNQAFLNVYGYEREDVVGRNPRIIKSRHSTPELYKEMWRDILSSEKGYWRGEIINISKSGKEIAVLLCINAIRNSAGEITNFLAIALDMTREKELDRMNRLYIDYIIHDIRGPLTAIMSNSELLKMYLDGSVNEKTMKKFDVILSSVKKLAGMTSDILDYSRAQNGNLYVNKQKVGFLEIFRSATLPFEGAVKKFLVNGAEFKDSNVEDRQVYVDSDKTERIIYNLLNNSFRTAAREVRMNFFFEDQNLKLSVSNDGKILTADEVEKIFELFYRTDEGIKTGSAGLGLSIVKSFTEAHGGRVWVDNNESETCYNVLLPID